MYVRSGGSVVHELTWICQFMDNSSTLQEPSLEIPSECYTNTAVPDTGEEQAQKSRQAHMLFLKTTSQCNCSKPNTALWVPIAWESKAFLKWTHTNLISFSFPKTYSKPKGNIFFPFYFHKSRCFRTPTGGKQSSLSVFSIDASWQLRNPKMQVISQRKKVQETTAFWNQMSYTFLLVLFQGPCFFPHYLKRNGFQARAIKTLSSDSSKWKVFISMRSSQWLPSLLLTSVQTIFYIQFARIHNLQPGKGPAEPSSHSRERESEEKHNLWGSISKILEVQDCQVYLPTPGCLNTDFKEKTSATYRPHLKSWES